MLGLLRVSEKHVFVLRLRKEVRAIGRPDGGGERDGGGGSCKGDALWAVRDGD